MAGFTPDYWRFPNKPLSADLGTGHRKKNRVRRSAAEEQSSENDRFNLIRNEKNSISTFSHKLPYPALTTTRHFHPITALGTHLNFPQHKVTSYASSTYNGQYTVLRLLYQYYMQLQMYFYKQAFHYYPSSFQSG